MKSKSILIMFHCEQNTGYAIGPLERAFEEAAILAGFKQEEILWSYSKVHNPTQNVFELDYNSPEDAKKFSLIHQKYEISTILAFDLPFPTRVCKEAKDLGIDNIVSYWGASMSSINRGIKLLAKRVGWYMQSSSAPSDFIFESKAMRLTATHGRGVPKNKTHIIPLGVDTNIYFPSLDFRYAYSELEIPNDRKIIFYSGHMEERKGVRVLIEAMKELEKMGEVKTFHLLICGNKDDQSKPYEDLLNGTVAKDHVTFAGYRDDIPKLMRSSFLGTIASTGWDSFTMSSIEMLSSGLPLIVSNLQGLKETIVPGKCGEYINPGSHSELAKHILAYAQNPSKYHDHSISARQRALELFSKTVQVQRLSKHLAPTHGKTINIDKTNEQKSNSASKGKL